MTLKLDNGNKVHVEHIGVISLFLLISCIIKLKNVVFVLSMRRISISITCLDQHGHSCFFSNNNFKLYYDSFIIRIGTLSDGLYKIDLDHIIENSMNTIVGNERKRFDKTFSILCMED